ncbi:MAG TPA: hypothetical protein ENN30_00115 [Candidatus Woesearchaeota archaeon]|nr:hypothetical protein [Candidatus Woesearchaeota archaeon]
MNFSDIMRFYSNPEIRKKILEMAAHREIVARYNDKVGSRPDVILFDGDIVETVKKGMTSFHASMELWSNPLLLNDAKTRKEQDKIREGWDLVLDVDSKHVEYSKICAYLLCEAIEFHNIKNYFVKFSGGTGFHIAVPFNSFPKEVNGKEVRLLFPEGARIIASYLREMIKSQLAEEILAFEDIKAITKRTGKKFDEVVVNGEFDPFSVLDIDSVAISNRHLFRMPYSFNEKTWLVSVPLKKGDLLDFKREMAEYRNVKPDMGFLDSYKTNEAKGLFIQAFDWDSRKETEKNLQNLGQKLDIPEYAIPVDCFPPCIKILLAGGLEDGRKRAVFILINFLRSCGWDVESMRKEIMDWNERNKEPLRENYINAQLNWTKRQPNSYLPPSCDNANYYKDLGVCNPDSFCKGCKNPIVYAFRRVKAGKKGTRGKK